MANDLSGRRRSSGYSRQSSRAGYIWKIGIPLLCVLAFLILLSRRQGSSTGLVHSTTKAQVQVSNCTHTGLAQSNVSCNCPPTINVTDGASEDGVLRLVNKVSSTTVEKILDAASTEMPAEKTVRVNIETPLHDQYASVESALPYDVLTQLSPPFRNTLQKCGKCRTISTHKVHEASSKALSSNS